METVKRTIEIIGDLKISDHIDTLLIGYGFQKMGKKWINYKTTISDLYELSIDLHDNHDLHLETATKWNQGQMINYYEMRQGYRCEICGGLDIEKGLKCIKEL